MANTDIVVVGQYEEEIKTTTEMVKEYASADARAHKLATAEDANEAADILNELKRAKKEIEQMEKSATAPLNESLKQIRSWFAPTKAKIDEASQIWDAKVKVYLRAQEEAQAKVRAALQAAVQNDESRVVVRQHLEQLAPAPKLEGLQTRKVWKFEVKNIELIPREYLQVNETLVRLAMKMQLESHPDEDPAIPGIRFYQDTSLARTGK